MSCKPKKVVQGLLAIGVIAVGVYMMWNFAWPTPPAVSGLGFLFTGLALWIPHCPIARVIFGE
ncbi:MAG: hypothetical protein LR008_02805 [Candidatus Pacebacteria bacterium]|nr:hypothetical protein [Candidatus Paceibacterota bacterium]